MSDEKRTVHDLIELLFSDVERCELHPDALREALEDARDEGQIDAGQFAAYVVRMERITAV